MARFDKKWLFVHVPAGLVTVALIAFGVVQCSEKKEYEEGLGTAAKAVKKAENVLKHNIAQMDSLLTVSAELVERNAQQADSIVVLNDSIDTLNGQVADLTVENDSLANALVKCKNSKKKPAVAKKTGREENSAARSEKNEAPVQNKPVVQPRVVETTPAPVVTPETVVATPAPAVASPAVADTVQAECHSVTANVCLNAAYNNGNVVIDNGASETDIKLGNGAVNNGNIIIGNANSVAEKSKRANIEMSGGYNNGNVVVETAPSDAKIALDSCAVNNGAIVVGNANTVYQVIPDTVVRFTTTKNTVVKCRVVAKQRQYR